VRDHEHNHVVLGLVGLADPVADTLARRLAVEESHDRLFVAGGFVGLNLGDHVYPTFLAEAIDRSVERDPG